VLVPSTVEIAGGRRQTVFEGGDGPPLVWLHALQGVDPRHPVIEALEGEHRVIAPLAPGFQDLDELDGLDNVHDLALHYDDLLDALNLDGATVVGHSFGAMIAAELAAHVPRRVGHLVLISPIGLWRDDYPVADLFARPYSEIPDLLYADVPPAPTDAPLDVEAVVGLVQGLATMAKFLWPIPDRGLRKRLRRVSAPTLVIVGENDAFVPPIYADDFVAAIGSARQHRIPGAGHMVAVERPHDVVAAIQTFLVDTVVARPDGRVR
jgi:pimeloyl-ACP methyl ester carboxylesterase